MIEYHLIVHPKTKSDICGAILRLLPGWFGVPTAIEMYNREVAELPFFAAYDGETPVGFAALKPHNAHTAEIFVMGVMPDRHGQGIGKALLAKAVTFCEETGRSYLTVKTVDQASPDEYYAKTRAFYQAMDFLPLEVLPGWWDERNPCLLMAKRIAWRRG